ncbi:MAG: hypothetical protein IPM37_12040 [Hahellaceae bacterium]|jgi:hypothetical protein|nr:hypothetical protein [Hahellaceae bacterium]
MKTTLKSVLTSTALFLASASLTATSVSAATSNELALQGFTGSQSSFKLTRPVGAPAKCAPKAGGYARVTGGEEAELLEVFVWGLPKNTEVDVFSIQIPGAPFGMSWYIGDIQTDSKGKGYARYIGRFNEETFIVAPNAAVAPEVHNNPIADANVNPSTAPIHTYHLGVWFNSPKDAKAAGCSNAVTPFNGEHNAGIQVLNTSTFPDTAGPLLNATKP